MTYIFEIDPRLRKRYWWLAVGIGLLVLIVVLSLMSVPQYVPMPGQMDKIYHALSYAVLMGWWLQLFPNHLMRIVLVIAFILFGVGIEFLQSFHPLRHLDVSDMLANTMGVLSALLLGRIGFDQLLYRFESWLLG